MFEFILELNILLSFGRLLANFQVASLELTVMTHRLTRVGWNVSPFGYRARVIMISILF